MNQQELGIKVGAGCRTLRARKRITVRVVGLLHCLGAEDAPVIRRDGRQDRVLQVFEQGCENVQGDV